MREKLDDDLPELTEGLVSLLWPHYLRTIPSLSIVELAPELAQMKRSERIATGFEVLSQPIGPQRTRCRYTTTQDLTLQPLALESVRLAHEPDGRSVLRLRFACGAMTDWSEIDLSRLPLYLNADAAAGQCAASGTDPQRSGVVCAPAGTGGPLSCWRVILRPRGLPTTIVCGPRATAPSAAISCCWSISPSARNSCSSPCVGWSI